MTLVDSTAALNGKSVSLMGGKKMLRNIIDSYFDKSIEDMTVKQAKLCFDVVYENICDDCVTQGINEPDWDIAFGLWCGV